MPKGRRIASILGKSNAEAKDLRIHSERSRSSLQENPDKSLCPRAYPSVPTYPHEARNLDSSHDLGAALRRDLQGVNHKNIAGQSYSYNRSKPKLTPISRYGLALTLISSILVRRDRNVDAYSGLLA